MRNVDSHAVDSERCTGKHHAHQTFSSFTFAEFMSVLTSFINIFRLFFFLKGGDLVARELQNWPDIL